MEYKSDIEIAREASKLPIQDIGNKLDIPADHLLPFGHDKAKISTEFIFCTYWDAVSVNPPNPPFASVIIALLKFFL